MTTIKEIGIQVTELQLNVSRLMTELEISRHENAALLEELRQANDLLYKVSAAVVEPEPLKLTNYAIVYKFIREKFIPICIEGILLAALLFIFMRLF